MCVRSDFFWGGEKSANAHKLCFVDADDVVPIQFPVRHRAKVRRDERFVFCHLDETVSDSPKVVVFLRSAYVVRANLIDGIVAHVFCVLDDGARPVGDDVSPAHSDVARNGEKKTLTNLIRRISSVVFPLNIGPSMSSIFPMLSIGDFFSPFLPLATGSEPAIEITRFPSTLQEKKSRFFSCDVCVCM
jgi:hypothetical protein